MPLIAMNLAPESLDARNCASGYGPYFLCGWRVRSAMPMPELVPWPVVDGETAKTADIELVVEQSNSSSTLVDSFGYSFEANGEFVLHLPGLATYRVSADAAMVTLAAAPDADARLLRAHFYGSIVAVLCFLRRLLPLHGACVRMSDTAVIFTGASGAGKSTLAAAFARRGSSVLCDDVCAIQLASGGPPQIWPAFPRLKLLPDAIATFALDRETLYTRATLGDKGHFLSKGEGALEAPAVQPVGAIYLLSGQVLEHVKIAPMLGAGAFLQLRSQVHRSNMGAAMGLRSRIFHDLAELLARVPVFQLNRSRNLESIDEMVQAITHHRTAPLDSLP